MSDINDVKLYKLASKLAEEYRKDEGYREKTAITLLRAGVSLIPCDYLQDHQFIVSRGVYEAAKRIVERTA